MQIPYFQLKKMQIPYRGNYLVLKVYSRYLDKLLMWTDTFRRVLCEDCQLFPKNYRVDNLDQSSCEKIFLSALKIFPLPLEVVINTTHQFLTILTR